MAQVKSGDYVTRHSYHGDIIFRVKQIYRDEHGELSAVLKGVAIPMRHIVDTISQRLLMNFLLVDKVKLIIRVLVIPRLDLTILAD